MSYSCYTYRMIVRAVSGMLIVVAVAAFTASSPREPQSSETKNTGKASQDPAKQPAAASPGTVPPSGSKRTIPCKTPENALLCYWTHGRLSVYNGNPSLRIWKIGAPRILGVFNGPSHFPPSTIADDESPDLPVSLERAYEADHRRWKKSGVRYYEFPVIFADFEVCPLEPEKKDEMQAVCVESAKNIFLQKFY
jgi:hypothetical protein